MTETASEILAKCFDSFVNNKLHVFFFFFFTANRQTLSLD